MIGHYVTVIRGRRVGYLFGPIACADVARMLVPYVRSLACAVDLWCDFDAFGVTAVTSDKPLPPGVFNR